MTTDVIALVDLMPRYLEARAKRPDALMFVRLAEWGGAAQNSEPMRAEHPALRSGTGAQ